MRSSSGLSGVRSAAATLPGMSGWTSGPPPASAITGLVRRTCAETLGLVGLPTPEEPSPHDHHRPHPHRDVPERRSGGVQEGGHDDVVDRQGTEIRCPEMTAFNTMKLGV